MTENEALGIHLLHLRKDMERSREWVANAVGISHVQLRTLEHGKGNPRLDTVQKLAEFYKTTVIELYLPPEE